VRAVSQRKKLQQSVCMVFAFLVVPFGSAGSAPSSHRHDPSAYACDSKTFDLRDFGSSKGFVRSPDRQNRVVLTSHGTFSIQKGRESISTIRAEEISSNIEIGWSPDSSQFRQAPD
jgi:hypothetical protein